MTRFRRPAASRSARLVASVFARRILQALLRCSVRLAALRTPIRTRCRPAFGILSARTLVILIVLVTIGLARGHQARAQNESNPATANLVKTANLTDEDISNICKRYSSQSAWNACWNNYNRARTAATDFLSDWRRQRAHF